MFLVPPETHSENTPNLIIFIVTAYKKEFSQCSARAIVNTVYKTPLEGKSLSHSCISEMPLKI